MHQSNTLDVGLDVHQDSIPLIARGRPANQVVVAMVRELMGCMWAIAKQGPLTSPTTTGKTRA